MKLSALLLTIVIALGMSAPLAAKTRRTPPQAHARAAAKALKGRRKPVKPKPMKYRKAKRGQVRSGKARKVRTPRSV
jgi:hypothetical protein